MYLRDMYQCQYCADTFSPKELTIDHILPISKGKTNWENCTTACTTCNIKKEWDKYKAYYSPVQAGLLQSF